MMGNRKLVYVGLAMFMLIGLTSCQYAATPTLAELSEPGTAVGISDDSCPTVIVQVGRQISWTNQGKQEHIVRAKSAEGKSVFDSGTLQPGDNFAVTLKEPGDYPYECTADGSLRGTITVEP